MCIRTMLYPLKHISSSAVVLIYADLPRKCISWDIAFPSIQISHAGTVAQPTTYLFMSMSHSLHSTGNSVASSGTIVVSRYLHMQMSTLFMQMSTMLVISLKFPVWMKLGIILIFLKIVHVKICFCFRDRVFLCNPGWSQIYDLPSSVS